METIPLRGQNDAQAAFIAAEKLRRGGVVLYPTDTLYGLGADAFSDVAVDKIYRVKGRDEKKPIHALVADLAMAARFGDIDERVEKVASNLPAGKITFVVRKTGGLEAGIARGIDTFGFRIPDNAFCLAMIEAFGGPITATSANRAGESSLRSIPEIVQQLGDSADMIDLAVDAGELPRSEPSTVIDLREETPLVLREGAVSAETVEKAFRS